MIYHGISVAVIAAELPEVIRLDAAAFMPIE